MRSGKMLPRPPLASFSFAVLGLLLVGCSINPIPTPLVGDAAVGGASLSADVSSGTADIVDRQGDAVLSDDVAVAGDVGGPEDAEGQGDSSVVEDVEVAFSVLPASPETECVVWGVMGSVRVALSWTTSVPTTCVVDIESLNGGGAWIDPDDPTLRVEHAVTATITAYEFSETPPAPGDTFTYRARCTSGAQEEVIGPPMSVTLDADLCACLWPFDEACGDGTRFVCRVPLTSCEEPRVPSVIEGCGHCVFPSTCTCDDGAPLVCGEVEPDCLPGAVAAVQGGCWVCVDPWSCEALRAAVSPSSWER